MAALLISAGNAFAQAPLNDDFAGRASLIGENATVNGSNFNATAEAGEPFFGAGTNSVWWSWTAPATGEFRINTVGSSFDTTLAVFTGSSVGELTRIASDDDSAGAGKSQVSFMARAGKQYQIQVSGGVYSAQGGIKLTISNNDSFVNRGILWGNIASAIGSNANATAEAGEPFPAAGRDSVWWSWTAPSSGTAILRTFNSKFDTVLAVYTGTSVSSLTMVGSNDDDATTLQSHLEIPVTEGVQYQIQVSSHDGQTGPISLSIAYVNTAAPDSISLSKGWMDETDSTGVTVATLGSTDPDAGDVAVFSLVPGEGAEDNESFTVSGNQLRTKSSVLYDAKRTVFIRLRATDRGGLSFERAFSMLVVPAVPNAEFVRKSLPFIQAPNYVNAIFQLIGKENGKAINYPRDFFDPGSGSYRPQLFRAFEAASITQSATPVSLQESYMQVAKLEEVPAKVRTVLLLDISRSLALDDLAAIKEAAKQMVDLMFDEQEIAIFSFAGSINPVAPFTGNKSKDTLKAAIDKISRSASNTTNLYGGIAGMLRLQAWKESFSLNGIETGFLVALTDGEDTSGSASLEDVIRLRDDLDPSDGVVGIRSIYTVGLGASINEEVLADIGNAGYYGVTEASSLAGKFVEIQRDIIDQANSYYWVNYSSPKRRSTPPGQLRKLELRLLNNANTEPDGVLSSTFLSDTFTELDSALYINRSADKPAGDSVMEIPRDTFSTASAFTIYPPLDFSAYTWSIGNPLLAEIVETSDEGDRVVIQPKGHNGTTTLTVTDVISDAVGDFTKEITLVLGSGVNPSTQTINFAALPDKSPSSLPFPLSGSSSSGLPVSFRIVSGPATITGNTVTLTGGTGPVTVRASQAGDESHYAAPDVTRTFNVAQDPLAGFLSAAGIPLEKQGSMDDPDGDGVGNLLEYAFNLNPASPAGARPMDAGGLSGLPRITANPNGVPPGFQIEYLRRKGGALLYTPEVSNDLKTFTPMPGTPAVSSINTEWERVNLTESSPPSAARRFARVRVSGTVVPGAPAVTIPPVATQMHTGKTATLRVEGSGSGLSYQWYRGNVGDTSSPVGTNSPIFTTPPLTATTPYWVRITNASGSTDSPAAVVTVTQPVIGPVIAVQPRPVTYVPIGTAATLSAKVNGTPPLTYQWYEGAEGDTSTPVGTDSESFTTPPLAANKSYWVSVANVAGDTSSGLASVITGIYTPASTTSDLAEIPAGSFTMGRTSGDTNISALPVTVNVSAFYIGKQEVTKALWDEVRTWGLANGYADIATGKGKASNHPVHSITWNDAAKWCNARSEKEGLTPCYTVSGEPWRSGLYDPTVNWSAIGYRLPTEAEWEKAARGGVNGARFPWGGDRISHSLANYNSGGDIASFDDSAAENNYHPAYRTSPFPYTSPVGSFTANGYGLMDVAGNVSEWCWDWYSDSPYVNGAKDPRGGVDGWQRVVRGGSWGAGEGSCRAASRGSIEPSSKYDTVGLRVARGSGSPRIIVQPASTVVASGSTATLTVAASGTAPFTYQWYHGEAGSTTSPVGTDSATFTTPVLDAQASYWVRVSNASGIVDSATATVSMAVAPTISTPPASTTIVSGNTATVTVIAGGTAPLTYQWYKGAVGTTTAPVGTNSSNFTTPALTETTTYWVRVSNLGGGVNSALATVTVIEPPSISTEPASTTILSGQTATLTVAATGTAPLAYQWYQGAVGTTTTPVGTNSASFTTPALTATTAYWVRVSNAAGSVNSSLATSSIAVAPSISTQPASATIASGNTSTLTVTASGTAPLTYQWYQGAVGTTTTPVGTNSSSFTTPVLTATTTYWVRVSNLAGSLNSTLATVTVLNPPSITTQPAATTITSGQTATLTVTALGTAPLTYQWYEGSVGTMTTPVGANSASFTTPVLTVTTSYWVRVSNTVGNVQSALATVTVNIPPSITTQPASIAIASGQTTTLNVTCSGTAPLMYQWYEGAVGTTTNPVGADSASFTTPALTETTSYWVLVSNTAGNVKSTLAEVTVGPELALIPAGSFTMGRTSGDTDFNAPPVTVTVSAFYIGKNEVTKFLWDEVWRWAVANGYSDLAEGAGKASDHPVHSISWFEMIKWCNARSEKEGLTPCYKSLDVVIRTGPIRSPTVNWTANGYRLPTEAEWEKAARGGVSGKRFPWGTDTISQSQANYVGSTSLDFDLGPAGHHPTYKGTTPYTSPVGSFAANGYGINDMAGNVSESTWDFYEVEAYLDGAIDPRGPVTGNSRTQRGGDWSQFASACRVARRNSSFDAAHYLGFRVARSTVEAQSSPGIITQPSSASILSGQTATLTVTASGSAPLTYQWYRGPVGTTTTPLGTNSASFTTPALTATTTYWVRVSNAAGSVNSTFATVTVTQPPAITTQPVSTTINSGSTTTLTVTASGSAPLTYQWYRGPVGTTTTPVGTNSSSYTTPALTATTTYWVRVSNTAGSLNSTIATVTVATAPSITTHPASTTLTSGGTATLTVTASGTAPLTYQWYQGAEGTTTTPVGSNSASFTTPALTATNTYWVRVSNMAGNVNSTIATISVRPGITSQPTSVSIASGQTATLSVSASGPAPLTYQWYQGTAGTTTTPVGTNSASFTTPPLTATTTYWVRVSNAAGSVDSSTATISIRPSISVQPVSTTISNGQTATLTVTAAGSAPLTYQWYQGAVGVTTTPVGTDSVAFTTPALTATTTYWVRITNAAGSVDSGLATMTVATAPSITTQPVSATINSGSTATLTVTASGSSPLTYQWFQGAVGTTTTPVGTNSSSFTTTALTATTTYWVRVSNAAGNVNSTLATVTVGSSTPADLALIPAGAFQMGVTSGDTDSNAPSVSVTVSAFYMGRNEVTKALWDEVRTWATGNGYTDLAGGAGKATNHPVHSVSWWDVIKWCNARSEKEGLTPCYTVSGAVMKTGTTAPTVNWNANGYRLPTEAEWEKAARGGVSGKRFPWGTDTISHSQANYHASSSYIYDSSGSVNNYHPTYFTGSTPYTSPVGSFATNGYGLNDMAGNVFEWCWDWYGASTYVNGATDPRGAASGTNRVRRGGSWINSTPGCRAAARGGNFGSPADQNNSIGFRIVRSSVP